MWDDGGVALADAGRLHDDQVEAGGPAGRDGLVETVGQLGPRGPGGEGPEMTRPPRRRRRHRRAPAPGAEEPGSVSMAFMRMRSPSSAPPPLRRVGSTASTAMRSLSSWSTRNRRTSSSVSDDLPDPPVPVMPSTGAAVPGGGGRRSAWRRGRRRARPLSTAVMSPGQGAMVTAQQRPRGPGLRRRPGRRSHSSTRMLTMAGQPEALAVLRREDPRPPRSAASSAISAATMIPPPPPYTLMSPAAVGPQAVHQVLEVLDVAALVGAHRHPLHVLLHRRRHHLVDRPVVAEVDDLDPLGLQQPAHDVDGRVVAVEQAGRRDRPRGEPVGGARSWPGRHGVPGVWEGDGVHG